MTNILKDLENQVDIIHEQNQMEMLEIKSVSEKNSLYGLICRLEATNSKASVNVKIHEKLSKRKQWGKIEWGKRENRASNISG